MEMGEKKNENHVNTCVITSSPLQE